MECPRCKSDNITYSHRRGIEKVLRYIWPWYVPYRCKECWTRFWVHERKFASMVILGLIVVLLVTLIIGIIVWSKPSDRKIASNQDGGSISTGEEKRSIADQNPLELPEKPVEKKPEESVEKKPEEDHITEEDLFPKPDKKPENKGILKKDTEPSQEIKIEEKPEEKKEAAVKPEPPEKKPAQVSEEKPAKSSVLQLKGIKPTYSDGEFRMTILANEPVREYKVITLNNPPRLVINLKGNWKNRIKNELNIEGEIIRRIRIGEHADISDPYLSIVMDAGPDVSLKPKFEESSEGLILILGK